MKAVSVATTETEVLPKNPGRNWFSMQNVSDTDIYICYDGSDTTALTSSNGQVLAAGSLAIITIQNGDIAKPARNRVRAIHAGTGTKSLRIQEG